MSKCGRCGQQLSLLRNAQEVCRNCIADKQQAINKEVNLLSFFDYLIEDSLLHYVWIATLIITFFLYVFELDSTWVFVFMALD